MSRLTACVVAATLSLIVASCGSESRSTGSPASPSAVLSTATPSVAETLSVIDRIHIQGIPFPAQNEVLDFLNQLEAKYRDQLRRGTTTTFVDPTGHAVWMADYLRYRVNACNHTDAVAKVLTRVDTQGTVDPPECGSAPAGRIPFPPQNEPLDFLNQLENKYRVQLQRPVTTTFVDATGQAVWIADYLRYRLNACSHPDAVSKVFMRVDSEGTVDPPVCSGPPTTAFRGDFHIEKKPCVAPSNGPVSCDFVATASGGNGSYSYQWTFVGPSGTVGGLTGRSVSPTLGCSLSSGVVTFQVNVTLKITSGTQTVTVGPSGQQIVRQDGACGT